MYYFPSKNKCSHFVFTLVIISTLFEVVYCASASSGIEVGNDDSHIGTELQKELSLTKSEKNALDKLKLVMPKESMMPYLNTDLFQIRWLRARSLDVDRTVRDVNEFIKLRRKQRVSNFWKADWSDLFPRHPFAMEGFDRNGLPVFTWSFGEMDLRRIMLQGKREKLFKYFENVGFEELEQVTECNKKQGNITQTVFIVNLGGFSAIQQACPLCLSFFMHIFELNERFFPGLAHDYIVINAPSVYGVFLGMFRPAFSDHTNSVMKFFGPNKNKWKPYLDERIDPSQLPWEYGGTKVMDRDD